MYALQIMTVVRSKRGSGIRVAGMRSGIDLYDIPQTVIGQCPITTELTNLDRLVKEFSFPMCV